MHDTEDVALVEAARTGDAGAVDALIRKYQGRVYGFGLRMCGDADAASDVTQDTLLAAVRALKDFRGDAAVATWLYTIARHACLRQRRRSTFAPHMELSLDAALEEGAAEPMHDAPNPEELAAARELRARLERAIRALDPKYREVFLLRDVEGLQASEAAKVLGISVDALKSRLHRARAAIRREVTGAIDSQPVSPACPDVVLMLSRHLEGDLDPQVCAEMERHLDGCSGCRGACESLKGILRLCHGSAGAEIPAAVQHRIRQALARFLDR